MDESNEVYGLIIKLLWALYTEDMVPETCYGVRVGLEFGLIVSEDLWLVVEVLRHTPFEVDHLGAIHLEELEEGVEVTGGLVVVFVASNIYTHLFD